MADPTNITQWLQALPLPWLNANPNGIAEVSAYGNVIDSQIGYVKDATQSRFPTQAPSDALPHLGNERLLPRGPVESDATYALRLRAAWDDWARAGTAGELATQLWWAGFERAYVIQQNGLAFYLSGAPTAGVDPSSLWQIVNTSAAAVPVTSSVTTGLTPIPAGTPWWYIDGNTQFASRFVVVIPQGASRLMTYAVGTFSASTTATLTWSKPLESGLTYQYLISTPTVTDGGGGVAVWLDPSTVTTTGATLTASDAFTGSATVVAYPTGTNPFCNLSAASLGVLQQVIKTWRPARATCMGVYAIQSGAVWGWPVTRTWGTGTWGGQVVSIQGTWS